MADDHNISINVQASNAIRTLTRVGTGLSNMNNLVGKTGNQLAAAERQIQRYGNAVSEQAKVIGQLRQGQKELTTTIRNANRQIENQNKALLKARGALSGAKETVAGFQKELKTANKVVAEQATKIDRLKQAVQSYKDATNKASSKPIVSDKSLANVRALVSAMPGLTKKGNGSGFGIKTDNTVENQRLALGRYSAQLGLTQSRQVEFSAATRQMIDANKKNAASMGDVAGQNVALRYALYSTAATFGAFTKAGTAAFHDLLSTGIDFQKQMSAVIRTSQVASASSFTNSPLVTNGIITSAQQATLATKELTNQFLELQSTLPVSSADLTTIGTLAAQMGIAAQDVANFTEVTAKFSAATGIGAEEAATGLARLGQLTNIKDAGVSFEELASGILKTGVNSIATEHQILQAANNIASISNVAHLSSAQVTALASAMSSLGITSELQRSTITASFTKILAATNNGAAAAQKYGDILGISGQQFIESWGNNAYNTFVRLTDAIANGKDSVGTLQSLGLASQRLTPTLLKIGQNAEVFSDTLNDSVKGQKENIEVNRQFDIIAKTTAARLQVLSQSWDKFLIIVGSGAVDTLGNVAKGLGDVMQEVSKFASTPFGQFVGGLVTILGLLATAFFGVLTAVSVAGAGLLGLGYVVDQLGIASMETAAETGILTTVINTEAASALLASGKTALLTGSMTVLKGALRSLISPAGLATLAIAGVMVAITNATPINEQVRNLQGLSNKLTEVEKNLTTSRIGKTPFGEKYTIDADFKNIAKQAPGGDFFGIDRGLGNLFGSSFGNIRQVDEGLRDLAAKSAPEANKQLQALNKSWIANKGTQEGFAKAFPDTIAALSLQSGKTGATTKELALYYSTLEKGQTQEEDAAQLLQAQSDAIGLVSDGFVTAKEAHDAYTQAVQSAGSSFFDMSTLLDNAYGKDKGQGGGLPRLQKDLNSQITAYKKWADGIQTLTAKGSYSLAQSFIAAGPSSQQAVADALKLGPKARNALEQSMKDAAFFASKAYADTFAAQNGILADVYQKTLRAGGDPMKALHEAQKLLGNSDQLSAADVQKLDQKYHIKIDFTLSQLTPQQIEDKVKDARAAARAKPIRVPLVTGPGEIPAPRQIGQPLPKIKEWSVTEAGHNITLKVDPDTKRGSQILDAWRHNQYTTPVKFKADVDTSAATQKLLELRGLLSSISQTINVNVRTAGIHSKLDPVARAHGGGIGIPGFATGGSPSGYMRGPGTETSDSILARLSRGEFVINARSVREYGPGFFDALNRRQFPKYAQGGGYGTSGRGAAGATMNVNVVQNYPTTVDPLKKLKQDAEDLVAGIWS